MEWTLELVLVALLLATLLQAIRLERALSALKRDQASLESLVTGFNASTHQAESGIQRLRAAVDGAGRQIETQIAKSAALKDDLAFLTERGERLADRLDSQVRAAQPLMPEHKMASELRMTPERRITPERKMQPERKAGQPEAAEARGPAGFSQAELDLLAALRMAR